jgi:hypothetical protein
MEPAGARGSRQHVKKVWGRVGSSPSCSYIKITIKDMIKNIIKESIIGGLYLFGASSIGAVIIVAIYNI